MSWLKLKKWKKCFCDHKSFLPILFLGAHNWEGNKFFRAIDAVAYKKWRPSTFDLIKNDYDIYSSSSDSEIGDLPAPPTPSFSDLRFLNVSSSNTTSSFSSSSTSVTDSATRTQETSSTAVTTTVTSSSSYVSNREILSELYRLEAKYDAQQEESQNESANRNEANADDNKIEKGLVRECFRCPLCVDISYRVVYCHGCGQKAGCHDCITRVDNCPLCREDYSENRPKTINHADFENIL